MEKWQDRTCRQGLEERLLQDDTGRPRSDAVNQARASKINDSGYSAYQRVYGGNPPQMEDAVLECGGAHLGVVSGQQTGELAASLALDQKRRWKRALYHAAKHFSGELHVGQPLWFWRRGANAAKKPTNAFWHPGVVIRNTLTTVWIAYRGSVVKCARSQVRPFTEDDEAAHEHITEHERPGRTIITRMRLLWRNGGTERASKD